ncbi:MAG: hypothetical protein HXX12_13735 [Geothrix sp.]|uniref:PliI family lysozyme inhibitor of I-type lysozyme n=1 Tax=Geothrix sp. TaxID=1962974 RepID=UPI0017FDA0CC|nr:PliI family lysozyme inhibitor of I-type lysozyme [Geothrix sp.]NWJ42019.1 hypothetical protein [Geothrix sp.]WIL20012.1 MAG: PliI family lysozyme inhibitor of I-type lysozyme [Geothrix sp.]
MNKLHAFTLILMAAAIMPASEPERFVTKVKLPSGQTAVVAEGDFEPRSTGSFSIRLYDAAPAGDETTFFRAGKVLDRDGAVEKVVLSKESSRHPAEIIVIVRSTGTGGYLSAHAFTFDKRRLTLRASMSGLPANADPLATLRRSKRRAVRSTD